MKTIFIYTVTFTLAACSLLYELLLAQTISSLVSNTVLWYSLTIGLFLGTMGMGAMFCDKIGTKRPIEVVSESEKSRDHQVYQHKDDWSTLFKTEIWLSLLGGIAVFIVHFGHILFGYILNKSRYLPWEQRIGLKVVGELSFFLTAFLTVMAIGFLTGLELPLLIKAGNRLSAHKKITNRILGVDYFGSLSAALAFPLVLLSHFELVTIGFMTAILNLSVALLILFFFLKEKDYYVRRLSKVIMIFVLFLLGFLNLESIQQYFLKKYYYYRLTGKFNELFLPSNQLPKIERFSSPYHKIDLVKRVSYQSPLTSVIINGYSKKRNQNPDYPQKYVLFLNGEFQLNTDVEEFYHEYFAHVPIILNKTVPQKVLVLGAGDGLLIKELVKYPGIQSITHVELDPKIIQLVKTHSILNDISKGALEDPRVQIIIADAYQYMRNHTEEYDAIYMDFPDASEYNLSKLFSREFFSFVRRHLKEDGYAVFDAAQISHFERDENGRYTNEVPMNPWQIYFHTLKAAGFQTIQPYAVNIEMDNEEIKEKISQEIQRILEKGTDKKFITAYKFMRKAKGEDFIIRGILERHASVLNQGFIFIKNNPQEPQRIYKDPRVNLYVLNEQRFHLAFDLPFIFPKKLDESKVNSIMRPALPKLSSLYKIKTPH